MENEPILAYKKGSKERTELIEAIKAAKSKVEDVPIIIAGKEIRTNDVRYQTMPHNHQHKIAKFYYADTKLVKQAIDKSIETQQKWDRTTLKERLDIWERAAGLMAGKYRQKLNAATVRHLRQGQQTSFGFSILDVGAVEDDDSSRN